MYKICKSSFSYLIVIFNVRAIYWVLLMIEHKFKILFQKFLNKLIYFKFFLLIIYILKSLTNIIQIKKKK